MEIYKNTILRNPIKNIYAHSYTEKGVDFFYSYIELENNVLFSFPFAYYGLIEASELPDDACRISFGWRQKRSIIGKKILGIFKQKEEIEDPFTDLFLYLENDFIISQNYCSPSGTVSGLHIRKIEDYSKYDEYVSFWDKKPFPAWINKTKGFNENSRLNQDSAGTLSE